jgi:hypothetical protein
MEPLRITRRLFMTVGKTSALAAGFVGALALGVAIGPTVHDKLSKTSTRDTAVTESAPAPSAPAPAARATRRAVASAPAKAPSSKDRDASASEPLVPKGPPGSVQSVAVAVWDPDLRERVQSVLNKGTKLELAAEDFRTAEEFVTVAHAARNTSVPFMVLKHRVLNEGRTLSDAIREAKPDLDAKAEVTRAREAAQADLSD